MSLDLADKTIVFRNVLIVSILRTVPEVKLDSGNWLCVGVPELDIIWAIRTEDFSSLLRMHFREDCDSVFIAHDFRDDAVFLGKIFLDELNHLTRIIVPLKIGIAVF